MKEIIYNYNLLKTEEINQKITRVKALIINSKGEILLGYSYKTYQFPGGHIENGETLNEGLKRELQEETGMIINTDNLRPYMLIKHYIKNFNEIDINCSLEIYYYIINTDEKYNLNNTNYDNREKLGNYQLKYVPLSNLSKLLMESINDNEENVVITEEMLEALKEYQKITNKQKYIII